VTVHYLEIPIELLDDGSNVRAPAKRLSQSDVGLRASILELGVLQPITVVRRGKRFEVLYGHRRTAAARAVGLAAVPAIVETDPDEKPIRQLVENQHRQPVNPIDIARTLRAYLDEHPATNRAALARKLGRNPGWISAKLALLELDVETQDQVARGQLGEGHAYRLAKTRTEAKTTGRPRVLEDSDDGASVSVRVPIEGAGAKGQTGEATIGVDRQTGAIDFVITDGAGYGLMLTLTASAARLLGLRLTQAYQAAAAVAAAGQTA
jgi:ParB/RepB/Spo0J family partition protein